eukprot:947892_1
MAVSVGSHIPKQEYLHVLKTMDPCGQSDIIDKFIEEAEDYETKTTLQEIHRDSSRETLHCIENTIMELLQAILNDGAVPFDVAFCRLIIILPFVQRPSQPSLQFAAEFIAFFFYFIAGSCFPSLRKHIKSSWQPVLYESSSLIQYLLDSYFPRVNDNRCIKFKHINHSRHVLSSILEHYISTATEHGDPSIASIICDYVQYPNHEFIFFIQNFLWHFPSHLHFNRAIAQCIYFAQGIAGSSTHSFLFSRVLLSMKHDDDRVKYEARRMALTKLKTGADISRYFACDTNKSIRCDVDPKLFVELFEFAVSKPCVLIRDAIVNHSLSMFFNGNNEEKGTVSIGDGDDILCKRTTTNVHYVFANMIDKWFHTNDMELVRKVLFQLKNCRQYFLNLSVELSEVNKELLTVLSQYISKRHTDVLKEPPHKKRRLNGQENDKI